MDDVDLHLAAAERLLDCRRGARRAEVQNAYRRTLLRARPDLGRTDGLWTARVQAARDLLLACAAPERRRDPRRQAGPQPAWLPRRRATWGLVTTPDPAVDVRL